MASQNPDKDDSKETIGNIEESSLLSNGNVHQSLNEVPLNGEPVNELRDNDTGPEYKATETITDVPSKESLEESKWGGSRLSLCLVEKSVGSYACNGNSQFQPDNGDHCTSCLLSFLLCEFCTLCNTLFSMTACLPCEESCLGLCCMICEGMENCCRNPVCLDICSECCGLCFPS
ncbi:myoD family inhibitor domain-containing protein-like isoform X3 [Acipenser ruthenus]|uniref:myoD family inhibitor domain-containing protein-like isoform X3 n=1 Tax=Acipenser ruthenus TaxID=7906 RepID=UPI002741A1E3|nr:myoD family inhibitor domain-containing protein-like isoform X3 [Acipenser ruthenus]